MPLVGVKCDSPQHYGQTYSFPDCLNCAIEGGPRRCNVPYPMLVAMAQAQHGRKHAGISATMILDVCPRKVVLSLSEEFYEHPEDFLARFNGTLWHTALEKYSTPSVRVIEEVRFRKRYPVTVDGETVDFELTGKPDHVNLDRLLILDYKTCASVFAKPVSQGLPKPTHEEQLNIYLDLLDGGEVVKTGERVDIRIEQAGIIYVSPGARKPANPTGEPQSRFRKVPVRVWSADERHDFIVRRARPFVESKLRGELPPLLYDEKTGKRHWLCASKFCALREACDLAAMAGR